MFSTFYILKYYNKTFCSLFSSLSVDFFFCLFYLESLFRALINITVHQLLGHIPVGSGSEFFEPLRRYPRDEVAAVIRKGQIYSPVVLMRMFSLPRSQTEQYL